MTSGKTAGLVLVAFVFGALTFAAGIWFAQRDVEPSLPPVAAPVEEPAPPLETHSDQPGDAFSIDLDREPEPEIEVETEPESKIEVAREPLPVPAPAVPPEPAKPLGAGPPSGALYVVPGGKRYHRKDCADSEAGVAISHEAAFATYRPCPVCKPPRPEIRTTPLGDRTALAPRKERLNVTPRGTQGAVSKLVRALDKSPRSHRVEISWVDPMTRLERHFEYRRDTRTLTRWDGGLWEQWTEVPIEALYDTDNGWPLHYNGVYTYHFINPGVTDALIGRRDFR